MENNFIAEFQLRRQRKKRKTAVKILFCLFIIGVISVLGIYNRFIKNGNNDSIKMPNPIITTMLTNLTANPTIIYNTPAETNSLKEVVANVLDGTKGTYGIAIKNLKNGEFYYANEHRVFNAGSLYKLWIMAVIYQQIQNKKLIQDQILSKDAAVLNQKFQIATESAEQTEGTITFTINNALKQMITISHNYAALLLTEKIGLSAIVAFLKENGLTESTVGINGESPTVTPFDTSLFFEKLYHNDFVNQEYTDKMIGLLKNQQLNGGLPKYLPDEFEVAHKTGEIDFFKHDAGIVYTDKGDYIIAVLSESDSRTGAQEKIALMSKGVFEYFTKK